MKKWFLLLMATLLILSAGCALADWIPVYETYPVPLDDNLWIEVPNAYDVIDVTIDYPCMYIVDENMMGCLVVKIPSGYRHGRTSQSADLTGFREDGQKVLAGADATDASTVIERYTIHDLPAARVDMTGQGFEMIWMGDGDDLYFFMYPLKDEAFAADMVAIASTMHLVRSNTAPASSEADYTWTADETGVTITGYTGEATRVAIPAEIDGQPVVALADKAFYETDVTWVSIPDGVTEIGRYCFGGCTALQTLQLPAALTEIPDGLLESCLRLLELTIPEGVVSIGESAFWMNSYLEGLRLPASLTEIGSYNFVGMLYLERFSVAPGNTAFQTLDEGAVLLSADGKRFIHYCGWQDRSVYTIPEGVEVVSAFAFDQQPTLRSIIVPEGVTTIEGMAFLSVTGLQSLTLPASVTEIGKAQVSITDGIILPDPDAAPEDVPESTLRIVSGAVIIAPEGSAAQVYAEQFNLIFEPVRTADEAVQE
ncbi:MAG: leucine-rich repeat protein [Aristaeellaceae bacterium]